MSTLNRQPKLAQINLGLAPVGGPACISVAATIPASGVLELDLSSEMGGGNPLLEYCQALSWYNDTDNAFVVFVRSSRQRIAIPARRQITWPLFSNEWPQFVITNASGTGQVDIEFQLMNVPTAPMSEATIGGNDVIARYQNPTLALGQASSLRLDSAGRLLVSFNAVQDYASYGVSYANGATTNVKRICDASTNAQQVKASAGRLYDLSAGNAGASPCVLKLYNLNRLPVPGTDVPMQTHILFPNVPFNKEYPIGLFFSAGIAFSVTMGTTDNDGTALTSAIATAGLVVNFNAA